MDALFSSLLRNAGEFKKRFETEIKEEIARSKSDAKALLELGTQVLADAVEEGARLKNEIALELKVDSSLFLRQLQNRLSSEEFEKNLDDLLEHARKTEAFADDAVPAKDWISELHSSLFNFEGADEEKTRARRERIAKKLSFLFRFYRDGVAESALGGAFLGSFFGPTSALKFALVAGGVKLMFDLGGATYALLIKENGEISFA